MKTIIVISLLVCACCGAQQPAHGEEPPATPQLITPGAEVEVKPGETYYVLNPQQLANLNALFERMAEVIKQQSEEIESLREKTAPVGNCTG